MHTRKISAAVVSLLAIASLAFTGCTTMGVARDVDPATGKLEQKASMYGAVTPTVVVSKPVDVSKFDLILVLGGDYMVDQTRRLNVFDEVVDRPGMERKLIQADKDDLVTDVTNLISWKRIYESYQPFLVLQPDTREEGRTTYFQFKVVHPETAEDLFVSEVKLDYMWKGVHDDTVFVPLFNSLIDWLNSNGANVN